MMFDMKKGMEHTMPAAAVNTEWKFGEVT